MAQILPGIDHIVVLMLENRSFDNLFGGLYPASPDFHGLTGSEWNYNPTSPGIGTWTVWQAGVSPSATTIPFPDPGEEFTDMNTQLFQTPSPSSCPSPTMGGFAENYARQPCSRYFPDYPSVQPVPRDIMQYYQFRNLSVSQTLAKTYGVSDAWFAAAPVQTISNRTFVHTGTASRLPKDLKFPNRNWSRVNNGDYTEGLSFSKLISGEFDPPVLDTTIFEMLDRSNESGKASACSNLWDPDRHRRLNWKVYYHDAPLSSLCKYVYDHWCLDYLYGGNVYRYHEHIGGETNFEFDIKHGNLPTYSFIEPAYTGVDYTANSNHPGGAIPNPLDLNAQNFPPPVDVKDGEALLGHVYGTLANYPEVFARTLLIVTYDEHGGLYDHVKPGMAVSPFSPAVDNFKYDRYGVRVPAILINPRIKGKVFRPKDGQPATGCAGSFVTGLDHTSIIATLCKQFNLGEPPTPRAAKAATLDGLLPAMEAGESEVAWDVVVAGAAANAAIYGGRPELGKSLRIRNWFYQRKVDSFEGDSLNNAVFATFAHAWFAKQRRSVQPLRELIDLDANAEKALVHIGVRNTHDLSVALAADGGIERVAKHVGADPARVLRWGQEAELLRVPGISGDDAYLLVTAGVTSIRELAQANSHELQPELGAHVRHFGIEEQLDREEVARWIDAAQRIVMTR